MLSTIVSCEDKGAGQAAGGLTEVLTRTLASLVTAKVEGILCDVRIAGPAEMGLAFIANHAGCGVIEAEREDNWLRLAIEAARGPWIFLLRCGWAPEAGFIEEARDFLERGTKDSPHVVALRASPESYLERLLPSLAPVAGLVGSRDLMVRTPRGSFEKLVRQIAPAKTFHVRARRIR
jgi:hypothetical protein